MAKYFGEWSGYQDLARNYSQVKALPPEEDIIVAAYGCDDNSFGDAFVLFKRDDKLFEVNDSHCSCEGLGNWNPEETTAHDVVIRNTVPDVVKEAIVEWWRQEIALEAEIIRGSVQ